MPLNIEAADVIRLIQQFFQENGLESSLKALQEETGVYSRTVDDVDGFIGDVCAGRWDKVLQTLAYVQLEPRLLIGLYEHVFWELAEGGDVDAARMILRESEPMSLLRKSDESKYIKLENGLSTAVLSISAGAKVDLVSRKEAKRAKLAQELSAHLTGVPRGRLLALLGEALRFEEQQQMLTSARDSEFLKFDIFRGIVPESRAESDAIPYSCYRSVTMLHGQHVEAAAFSPDGSYFAVGLADGFIEIWSPVVGKPRTDLAYQNHKADFMVMETSILCIAFTSDGQYLAVGTLNGDVAVFKVVTGMCTKRIPKAHTGGVSSIAFSPDSNTLLTAGYDNAVRLFNLRSGSMMRQFVGHTEFVHSAVFSHDGSRIMSASSDGTLRIWNTSSGECIESISPYSDHQLTQKTIKYICPIPRKPDAFIVCAQDSPLQVYGANGALGKSLTLPSAMSRTAPKTFSSACCSPAGKYIYAIGDDKSVYAWDYASGALEKVFEASAADEIIGAAHHPQLNIMVTFDTSSNIKFWKSP